MEISYKVEQKDKELQLSHMCMIYVHLYMCVNKMFKILKKTKNEKMGEKI